MHIADMDLGILGANGIVGAGLPIAVGAALSSRLKGTNWSVVCFFGDGASNTGAFHEALNLAAIWKLPVVFVCENNLYGMFSPLRLTTSVADIADRAHGYGIPGVIVDGNDVLAVHEAAAAALARARAGDGPTLLECKTYRHLGHFVGDPALYRDGAEVEEWKLRDPIARFKDHLVERGILTENTDGAIQAEIESEVTAAVAFALASPEPPLEELTADVYVPLKPIDQVV